MNRSAAVDAAIRSTRAERAITMPNCAITRPQNRIWFLAMAVTTVGEPAITQAVSAVTARPRPIQPYTPRRKAVTRSSAVIGSVHADGCVMSSRAMLNSLGEAPLSILPHDQAQSVHDAVRAHTAGPPRH